MNHSPNLPDHTEQRESLVEFLANHMPGIFSQAVLENAENDPLIRVDWERLPNLSRGTVEGFGFFFVEGFDEC